MDCPHCKVPLMGGMKECPKCKYDISYPDGGPKHQAWLYENSPERKAEKAKQERQEIYNARVANPYESDTKDVAIESLRKSGADGYYEYAVKTVYDEWGHTDTAKLVATLNEMGLAGWHLATAHTNELGKNALMLLGFGMNSTADETVLIFERFVRI